MISKQLSIIWDYGMLGIIQISKYIYKFRTYVYDGVFPIINFT